MQMLANLGSGIVLNNQLIPNTRDGGNHPQPCDVYEPNGTIRAFIVALHGGGGTKEQFAASLGVLLGLPVSSSKVAWNVLQTWGVALIVPQGSHCSPSNEGPWNPNGVNTVSAEYPNGIGAWSNRSFWSGADDPQFTKDAAAWGAARYGSGALRILAGHSAGGIMVNRKWYEHSLSGGYTTYVAASGPAAAYYRDNPSTPVIVKPFLGHFGALDTNLQIDGGKFYNDTWELSQPTKAWVQIPNYLVGELQQLQARVTAYNAQHSLAPQTVTRAAGVTTAAAGGGTVTTWSYSGGANVVRLYSAAAHSTRDLQRCSGRRLIVDWMVFAFQNA